MARSLGAAAVALVVLAFLVASAGNSFDDQHTMDPTACSVSKQPSIRLYIRVLES